MYRALVLTKQADVVDAAIQHLHEDRLPGGDVVVEVLYSSLNYKDGLAVTGRSKVVRAEYPFVPGIDLVGRVRSSTSQQFQTGDVVIGTGWGLGESRWGGYAEVQAVRSEWLIPLPDGMTPEAAMIAGTAGLTAMVAVMEIRSRGISPKDGEVLVTGASGGVGSMAVALLHGAGFTVAAATGSDDAHDYLRRLGAHRIVDRSELASGASRPMESATWSAAVDVVGGRTLETVLSRLDRRGTVAVCGLAGGHDLHTTVYPFILRGVSMLGVDSNTCPDDARREAWDELAASLTASLLNEMRAAVIRMDEIPEYSRRILSGDVRGRVVVDVRS